MLNVRFFDTSSERHLLILINLNITIHKFSATLSFRFITFVSVLVIICKYLYIFSYNLLQKFCQIL